MSHQRRIDIKGKQALAWKYLNDKTTTEVLYGGGAGGGKSYLGVMWHMERRIHYPGSRGMIGRGKIADTEQSTLQTLFLAAKDLGYQQGLHFKYNGQKHIINWANGSQTILKDLFQYPSDPEFISLGSTEYTDAFIDEVTEITEKAVELVSTRIRWKLKEFGLTPKLLMTCNPSPGWVKDVWIEHHGKPVILPPHRKFVRALVTDNPDKEFVESYRQQLLRMRSDYDRARLLEGDWNAEATTTNPFAHQFSMEHHVSEKAIFRPDIPITISVDFNINPFAVTFAHAFQGLDGKYKDHTFDEADIDDGSLPAMIDLIRQRYGKYLHAATLTGDAMGASRDISQRDNASYYIQLARGLGLSDHQVQVPANPTHRNSRSDVNYLLHQAREEGSQFEVLFHPVNAKESIRDLRSVRCDNKGKIIKAQRLDPSQRADYLDTIRYRINLKWKKIIMEHQQTK